MVIRGLEVCLLRSFLVHVSRPPVFRLPSQKALINRYGLNSEGADSVAMRLRQRLREFAYAHGFGIDEVAEQRVLDGEAGVPPGSLVGGQLLAVQVAKNSFTPDEDLEAVKRDYVYCVEALARYADILVVNGTSAARPLVSIIKPAVRSDLPNSIQSEHPGSPKPST